MASGTKNIENATPDNGATGDVTQRYLDSSASVLNGISGTFKSVTLDALQAPADADTNRWTDSTGCKSFRIRPLNGLTTAVTALVYGFSTDVSDFTALNSLCDSKIADLIAAAPSGIAFENVKAVTPIEQVNDNFNNEDWIVYDGTTLIKTILVKSEGADQGNIELELMI